MTIFEAGFRPEGLVVLVPTRQRPYAIAEMCAVFARTCVSDTWLVFCVDGCPAEETYRQELQAASLGVPFTRCLLLSGLRRGLVGTLNYYSTALTRMVDPPQFIAYMGDDHRPLTVGWDAAYLEELRQLGVGLVYGDDRIQGANLPTQVAMTINIISELGYMAPPSLVHLYCDNYWKDLGEGAGCLRYLPEVVVEHWHPANGVAVWDASYAESNSSQRYAEDGAAYREFKIDRLARDIQKVKQLREAGR